MNPGLVALSADTTDVSTPFTPTDPKLLSLAAEDANKDPKKVNVLSGMMQRMEDLQNPWKRFQGQMDEMVARTHFQPEGAMASVNEQQGRNAAELQNIGTTLAQLKFLQDQQAGIRAGFTGGPSGAGGVGSVKGVGGTSGVGGDPKAQSGYMYKGIPLTNMEYENLAMRGLDPAEFKAAFKDMTNINTREQAKFGGPEGQRVQEVDVVAYDKNGKLNSFRIPLTINEKRDYENGILPYQIREAGYTAKKPVQKKASGGVVLQNYLAGGGQPTQPMGAEVEVGPLYTDAGVEMPNTAPVRQPGMLENALTALSSPAQAQQAVIPNRQFDPQYQRESAISEQKNAETMAQEKNKAELASTTESRKKAGELISSIGAEAIHYKNIEGIAQAIIDAAKEHPKDFGYSSQEDSLLSYPLTALGAIPYLGPNVQAGAEKIKALAQGEGAVGRRALTNTNAQQLGMDYVRESLANTGAKMGLGLTNILAEAKGVGIANTPEQNLLQATKIKYMAKEYQELAKKWQEYQKKNRNPDPLAFLSSPEVLAIQEDTQVKIKQDTEPYLKKPKNGTKGTDIDGNEFVWKDGKPMRIKQ